MKEDEALLWLIKYLLEERKESHREIPRSNEEKNMLFRALLNVRMPVAISKEFLEVQDFYLQKQLKKEKVVDISSLDKKEDNIYLWRGDITKLEVDAIVNAANEELLGCFIPCHRCIDNAIHSAAGVQLRLACKEIMDKQGHYEETGKAKITEAFNLPSEYVIHTVGPIVYGELEKNHCDLLESSYNSCLELARTKGLKTIAFCCISTGEFHFPQEIAANIAINTVRNFIKEKQCGLEVIFNVFTERDYEIYKGLLGKNK